MEDELSDVTPEELLAAALSPEGLENPYPHYGRLQEAAPVFISQEGVCYVSSHEFCERMLADARVGTWGTEQLGMVREDWRVHPAYTTLYSGMFTQDPPLHTGIRKKVMRAFAPRQVERLRESVIQVVDRCADDLAATSSGGIADFMETFAFSVPATVVGDLIGVPQSDHLALRDLVRDWVLIFEAQTEEEVRRADEAAGRLWAYLGDLVSERRARPKNDMISTLLAAEPSERLSGPDLLNTLATAYSAGLDTVSHLFGNGLVALLNNPGQAQLVRTDPDAAATVTDEVLRYDSPGQLLMRVAKQDLSIGSVDISAGTPLTLVIGAANHDPSVFAEPARLDVHRTPNRHLAFSHGIHHCLGAALSRLEGAVGFPALLRRFPNIALAEQPTRRPGVVFRGYDRVPITV